MIANRDFQVTEGTRIAIEHVTPELDGGRFPVKREIGDTLEVRADIFKDLQEVLGAALKYRRKGETEWRETPMKFIDNDRWGGSFVLDDIGRYEYTIEAWTDHFATWRRDMHKRLEANQDVKSERLQGVKLLEEALERASGETRAIIERRLPEVRDNEDPSAGALAAMDPDLLEAVSSVPDRSANNAYDRTLEVIVDRVKARFSAWYELFPRSYGKDGRHGTFRDVIDELPRIAGMGFDTLYLPPIHPIGKVNRKGRNGGLIAKEGDPGSPWAIGSDEGGHKAIHPELGTLEDFRAFVEAAAQLGIEVALDFAVQAAPDHPWVKEHPGYFYVLPDGHIKYAENPPKKYEDIYPINFYGDEAESLWLELEDTVEYWIAQGVTTFRVDNPHTKPIAFWHWLFDRVKDRHPEVIFLAEAFTRPKVMRRLAKVGFTQSYTYYAWRNTREELQEYLEELTQGEMKEYFRGNLWPNTPDILTEYLVKGGLPAFRARFILAATLSSVYGIYSGYEVGDNEPHPGKEEYTNNEKFQFRKYDWNKPGNLVELITRVNRARKENPALQEYDNLTFLETDNDSIIAYAKRTGDNIIICVVNVDPHNLQHGWVRVPLWEYDIPEDRQFEVHDLITGLRYGWHGEWNYVRLDPHGHMGHVLRLERSY